MHDATVQTPEFKRPSVHSSFLVTMSFLEQGTLRLLSDMGHNKSLQIKRCLQLIKGWKKTLPGMKLSKKNQYGNQRPNWLEK